MIEDKEKYQYPKEATPEQVGDLARRFEEHRQMTGSDGRYDEPKPKPKKRVVEPIEIPEIISVPRRQPTIKTEVIESYNTEPEIGLSKRFTQDKMREAQISKQLDQELANERNRNRGRILNKEGKKYT